MQTVVGKMKWDFIRQKRKEAMSWFEKALQRKFTFETWVRYIQLRTIMLKLSEVFARIKAHR